MWEWVSMRGKIKTVFQAYSTQFLPLTLICDLQWNKRQEYSSILEYWIVVHDLPKGISWHSHSSYTIAITGISINRNSTRSTKFKFVWKVKSCENAYKSCMTILCLLLLEGVWSSSPPTYNHDVYASQPARQPVRPFSIV